MKLVTYNLCGLSVPMVDLDGVLYTTTPMICETLGVVKQQLGNIKSRYKGEFSPISIDAFLTSTDCLPKERLFEHLGLERIRKDSLLWPEDDVIGLTYHLKCPTAAATRKEFTNIIKQHARRDYVPMERVAEMIANATEGMVSMVQLNAILENYKKARDVRASAAGKMLNACKIDKVIH